MFPDCAMLYRVPLNGSVDVGSFRVVDILANISDLFS